MYEERTGKKKERLLLRRRQVREGSDSSCTFSSSSSSSSVVLGRHLISVHFLNHSLALTGHKKIPNFRTGYKKIAQILIFIL